jgi:hypothetical protein
MIHKKSLMTEADLSRSEIFSPSLDLVAGDVGAPIDVTRSASNVSGPRRGAETCFAPEGCIEAGR